MKNTTSVGLGFTSELTSGYGHGLLDTAQRINPCQRRDKVRVRARVKVRVRVRDTVRVTPHLLGLESGLGLGFI